MDSYPKHDPIRPKAPHGIRVPSPEEQAKKWASFYETGSERLEAFSLACLNQLPDHHRSALRAYLEHVHPDSIATMCSGTESPMLCAQALQRALAIFFGKDIWQPRAVFSSDSDLTVQGFLKEMVKPSTMFGDCTKLGKGMKAKNVVNNQDEEVPAAEWLVAGYPCPDVSRLNSNVAKSRKLVMRGGLRTGGVFKHGVLRYARPTQQN